MHTHSTRPASIRRRRRTVVRSLRAVAVTVTVAIALTLVAAPFGGRRLGAGVDRSADAAAVSRAPYLVAVIGDIPDPHQSPSPVYELSSDGRLEPVSSGSSSGGGNTVVYVVLGIAGLAVIGFALSRNQS